MLLKADTLDDALALVIGRLLRKGERILAGKGKAREFTGVLVHLSDPLARFSRTEGRGVLINFLGETLWYLSGSDRLTFIEYYIPHYRRFISASPRTVRAPGAYGPRLFGGGDHSQISKLISTLKDKQGRSDTRQAVAQIFNKSDLRPGNGDVPCTLSLQFLPRRGKLHLVATMRSNDVYLGFPGDVFAFTFIQELLARSLNLEVGSYSHFVGSLHLYDVNEARARDFLNEGFQTPMSMPPMPKGDPWSSVAWLLRMEEAIRCGLPEPEAANIDTYWLDLARLLRAKRAYDCNDTRQLVRIRGEMANPVYNAFLRGRQTALERKLDPQPSLPGIPAIVQEVAVE